MRILYLGEATVSMRGLGLSKLTSPLLRRAVATFERQVAQGAVLGRRGGKEGSL